MPIARRLAAFLIGFALVYGLLMLVWLGISEAYGRAYAWTANEVFGRTEPTRSVRVWFTDSTRVSRVEHWGRDVAVEVRFSGGLRQASVLKEAFNRSSRYTGFVPTAFLIALVLATPVPWKRRALALGLGLVLIQGFVLLMFGVMIWEWFYQAENHMLFQMYPELYPPWKQYLHSLWQISTWMMPYFAAPTLIWLLVTLRPSDLRALGRQSSG